MRRECEDEGDCCGHQEHDDHRVLELAQENLELGTACPLIELVRAHLSQPARSLATTQTVMAGLELFQRGSHILFVPHGHRSDPFLL